MRAPDAYRQAAMKAGLDYLDSHESNAIAKHFVIGALLAALVEFEAEWARDSESKQGYALVYAGKPIAVLPTMTMARQQRRQLARVLEVRRLSIRICETQYVC